MFQHIPPLAMSGSSPLSRFVHHLFGADEDTKLIVEHCIDSEGRLRMYNPEVQAALLECDDFRNLLVKKLHERYDEKEEKKNREVGS